MPTYNRTATLRVSVAQTHSPTADLDLRIVDTHGLQTSLNMLIESTGRYLPQFKPCDYDLHSGFKRFREEMGRALSGAQDALKSAQTTVDSAVEAMEDALGTTDKILRQNPDPNTPNSLDSLMDSIGGQGPTTDSGVIEERLGKLFDLNVVNGVLLPKGKSKLGGYRKLFQALELSGSGCEVPDLNRDFIFVTTYNETIETITGSTCGSDIIAYQVVERKAGENISLKKAAELSGKDEDELLIRFFWIDEAKKDKATQKRLKALGLEGQDLTDIVMAPKDNGRVFSTVLDSSSMTKLKDKLSDDESCTMMNRTDTNSGINLDATADDVAKTIQDVINKNTGSSRNRAGTSESAITPTTSDGAADGGAGGVAVGSDTVAPAGRAGNPAMLMLSVLDMARSMGIGTDDDGNATLDGEPIDVSDLSPECIAINDFINESVSAIQMFAQQGADFIKNMYGNLGFGAHSLSAGTEFSSCLGSINLGLDISLDLALGLPFQMQVFLGAFGAAIAAVSAAVLAIKAFLCIPQGVIQLLFGGICGFKPFGFEICNPDLAAMIDRLVGLLNMAMGLISQITGALQVLKADLQASLQASLDLKVFSTCALAAIPFGIGLGLAGALDLEASATVTGTTAAGGGATGTASGTTGGGV